MFFTKLLFLTLLGQGVHSTIYQNCTQPNHVTFTFGDGPNANTARIAGILDNEGVKGTFFINGVHVVRNSEFEETIRSVYENGHIIGTHTFSHAQLGRLSDFDIRKEMYDNELVFRMLFNVRPRYFSPPYFNYDDAIYKIMSDEFKYDLIANNVDIRDWEDATTEEIVSAFEKAISKGKKGYIVLLHDHIRANLEALPQMINIARLADFEIVSLEECLGHDSSYQKDHFYEPHLIRGVDASFASSDARAEKPTKLIMALLGGFVLLAYI